MALDWLWWRAWVPVDAVDAAAVFVAGVALGDIDLHFAWQAWHVATLTSLCVVSHLVTSAFAWQVWHLVTSTCTLRGRRGTYYGTGKWLWWRAWVPVDAVDAVAVWVARVALGDIDLHFAWQASHVATLTVTLHGRPGSWWHRSSVCVADVALGDIDAWRRGRRGSLRGRCGAW